MATRCPGHWELQIPGIRGSGESQLPVIWDARKLFFFSLHFFPSIHHCYVLKGTVSRDFLHQVFFINQFILVPLEMSMGCFIFLLFHRVIALLTHSPVLWKPGSRNSQVLWTQGSRESLVSKGPGSRHRAAMGQF